MEQNQSNPETSPTDTEVSAGPPKKQGMSKKVLMLVLVLLLIGAGAIYWFGFRNDAKEQSASKDGNSDSVNNIESFEACKNAGYPIQESFPERCVTPDGMTFTNESAQDKTNEDDSSAQACADGETSFQNATFGAEFCYPSSWGTASVMDAKVGIDDTGHREAVRFSGTTKFIVGGVSEDWSTTVGRDVGCQEPSNRIPELSEYDTEWHDIVGEGMAVEFALRSLPVSEGGYSVSEEVGNILESGVCARGHKILDGSRYRVLSAAYFSDFSDSAGITTPKAHMDNPNILFTADERQQLERLLSTARAY